MTSIPVRSKFATDAIARYAKATKATDGGAKFGAAFDKAKQARTAAKPAATTTAASTTARPAATTTAASTTARPASKSNLSEAKRAELSDAYKKSYAAATSAAKKASADRIANAKKTGVPAPKPVYKAIDRVAPKSNLSAAKRAELSATATSRYNESMDAVAARRAAATTTVKKATGGYVTKSTFKW